MLLVWVSGDDVCFAVLFDMLVLLWLLALVQSRGCDKWSRHRHVPNLTLRLMQLVNWNVQSKWARSWVWSGWVKQRPRHSEYR